MQTLSDLQIQAALVFLGYNPGQLDGIAGVKTLAALAAFSADYGMTGRSYQEQTAALVGAIAGTIQKIAPTDSTSSDSIGVPSDWRQYLRADGFLHIPKGENARLSEHFTSGEFDCQCSRSSCTETVLHPELVEACEDMRYDVKRPVMVNSGYRCPPHNKDPDVGGSDGSLHTLGLAADLRCPGVSTIKMTEYAEARRNYGEIGTYSDFIHLGVFRPDGRHTRWNNS